MAGTVQTTITTSSSGLGNDDTMNFEFYTATATKTTHLLGVIAVPNTAQPLVLGSISSVKGIWIKAITYALAVDTTWITPTFEAQITIPAGQVAYFVPSGVVYVKNNGAGEAADFEYFIAG